MIDIAAITTSDLGKLALDMLHLQQQVSAANVANAGDDQYVSRQVDFQTVFDELKRGGLAYKNSEALKARLDNVDRSRLSDHVVALDTPGVKLDKEMANMIKNLLRYQALLTGMSGYSSISKMAINEGKK
ncbi:MAG: hypothetical protein OEZ58_07960 [Gammaproteobacteria bacterium]|nr:hypothetical protein [Gammaproteobacteria bacterium]MDH5728911.1 hypothetical protein [Gammaproteobacteria bacterium]